MKTAGQIDGYVSFTDGQFARCPALNEPLENGGFFWHIIFLFRVIYIFAFVKLMAPEMYITKERN